MHAFVVHFHSMVDWEVGRPAWKGGGYKLSDNSRQTLENLDFDQTPFMDAPYSSWYSKKNWSIFDIKSIAEYVIDQ